MIKCEHCEMEYSSSSNFEEDSFIISDGLSWGFVHNCLKGNSEERLNGYTKEPLKINKNWKIN